KTFVKTDFINQTNIPTDPSIEFIDLSKIKSTVFYTIKDGDTIESIALGTLGSTDRWKAIAEYNGLLYPYITSENLERTLAPGNKIAIPSTQTTTTQNNMVLSGNLNQQISSDFSFGSDIFLDQFGDISVNNAFDIRSVSGVDNMKQAIRLKLGIFQGELLVHSDFGSLNLKGYRTLPLLSARAKSQFDATILSD